MNNTVFLRINDREWGGWTSVRIAAGIDRIARDFNVTITRRWPGTDNWPVIKNGNMVEVLIGDDLVITGYVEAMPVRYDAATLSMAIVGRSKTADLIDCSAAATQHAGRTLVQVATALAAPFGVTVIDAGAPATALPDVQPSHGEKSADFLHRLLGQVQALAYDDAQGRLVLGTPGSRQATTALVLGENILRCDTERSVRDRFSEYTITGQRPGSDDDFGETTLTAIKHRQSDSGVTRWRPLTLQQTGAVTPAMCKSRCEFEARRRAALTRETNYVVQGWRQGNGELWQPNQVVNVYDPLLGFDNEPLVIAEVTYSQSDQGTTTELRVGPADAYLPEPVAAKQKKTSEDLEF